MNNSQKQQTAINHGLNFIAIKQLKNGGFESYCSKYPYEFDEKIAYRTTFFTSLIASSLANVSSNESRVIQSNAAKFLLTQKSADWSYNYWDRNDKNYKQRPYPDDLDDTFCALVALHEYDNKLIAGDVLALVAHILFNTETKAGGPYRTWLVPEDKGSSWADVDPVVNSNIARFLAKQDVTLPNIVGYVENLISSDGVLSPYYPDNFAFLYFLSDWYRGKMTESINKILLEKRSNNFWGSPLNAALCVITLLRNAYDPRKLSSVINYLLGTQQKDGSWPATAFSIDLRNNGRPIYAGSSALTTAICLEAITTYDTYICEQVKVKTQTNNKYSVYYQSVIARIQIDITAIEQMELRSGTEQIFERILKKDNDNQILLLPRLLLKDESLLLDIKIVQDLSCVSVWGWMAYTAYDDFLDHEGSRELLPSANFCLRKLTNTLVNVLSDNKEFQNDVNEIMNRQETANIWELQNCRGKFKSGKLNIKKLPDYTNYWQLADRSLGHTIASIGVLYGTGYSNNSKTMRHIKKFFNHYLIARQLSDDAHDWEEDLRNGHINTVAVRLLQNRAKYSQRKLTNILNEFDYLRVILWDEAIIDICEIIKAHIKEARASLVDTDECIDREFLESLLVPVEVAADNSLAGRNQALSFIAAL